MKKNREKTLKVVVKAPGKNAMVTTVENDYRAIHTALGGNFETFQIPGEIFSEGRIVAFCNEDGKFNGMAENLYIGYDIVYGPVLVAGHLFDDLVSVPDDKIKDVCIALNKLGLSYEL